MTDEDLKSRVEEALEWEPSINAAHIGVAAEEGVITLTGYVEHYSQKIGTEEAVKRIKGVRAIAQEIEVRYTGVAGKSDDEIARRVADTIEWSVFIPKDTVHARVEQGYVTLSGSVEWNYEREQSERVISNLLGVTGVDNKIEVEHRTTSDDVKSRIENAIERSARTEARRINVSVNDGVVTLDGSIDTWHDREIAEKAAWSAPGVKAVIDNLVHTLND